MSSLEQLRSSVIERLEVADSHAIYIVDAVLKAEDKFQNSDDYPPFPAHYEESLRRLAEYKKNPSIGIPLEDVLAQLKADEEEEV